MRKRILQIISTPDAPGAEKQLGLLLGGLPPEEFDVHVFTFARTRWRYDPRTFWRLKHEVERLRPDLIHSWTFTANAYAHAVAAACNVPHHIAGVRRVDQPGGLLDHLIRRRMARRCSRIVVNSRAVESCCIHSGLPAEKLRIIPNAVEPSRPGGTSRRQWLAELGMSPDSRLIGSVGSLHLHKRIKDAIWAADLIKVIRSDVHLLIVGDGPHADRLHKFRDQVVIRDAVHFLGPRGDVRRIMPHFDAFWSTGSREGQSNPIMEAMAAGVPVVATDIPANRELIVPGTTGHLVPIGDRAGFARHTNQLLDNAELSGRLGQAGQERIAAHFGVEAMVDRYVELYKEFAVV